MTNDPNDQKDHELQVGPKFAYELFSFPMITSITQSSRNCDDQLNNISCVWVLMIHQKPST